MVQRTRRSWIHEPGHLHLTVVSDSALAELGGEMQSFELFVFGPEFPNGADQRGVYVDLSYFYGTVRCTRSSQPAPNNGAPRKVAESTPTRAPRTRPHDDPARPSKPLPTTNNTQPLETPCPPKRVNSTRGNGTYALAFVR